MAHEPQWCTDQSGISSDYRRDAPCTRVEPEMEAATSPGCGFPSRRLDRGTTVEETPSLLLVDLQVVEQTAGESVRSSDFAGFGTDVGQARSPRRLACRARRPSRDR